MAVAPSLRAQTPVPQAATQSAPQQPALPSIQESADHIFQRTAPTGMVVVAVRGDEVWMRGYGETAPHSHQSPTADSLIRLCSISKILATDLLVKLIAEGKAAFTDPLQKFAPAGLTVPMKTLRGPAYRPITLGDLATHTAGLPREIAYPPAGASNFTFPDFDYRWQWLPSHVLRTQPGTAAHYSNIGFDLLGDALAHASGKSYGDLFEELTAKPLGLADTTVTPNDDQCARLMEPGRNGGQCTNTIPGAASGGMYSTPRDMARVLRYFLDLPGVPVHANPAATKTYILPEQLKSLQGVGHAGLPTGLGLGWIEINGADSPSRIVQKTGGGAGYTTYIALNPANHAGVFIAMTEGRGRTGANLFREANDLLLAMVGLPPEPLNLDDPERERTPEELAAARAQSVKRTRKPVKDGISALAPKRAARTAKPHAAAWRAAHRKPE